MRLVYFLLKFFVTTLLLILIGGVFSFAQVVNYSYRNPLDLPVSLSANFAEIRPNHFHSGLDFRVGGVAGAKLYAVADGYISRINVSPFGYGKAIYIDHPNGQTSVYGHLDGFSEKVRKYIEAVQYNKQRFAVDETIAPEALPVKKGELIGYAGNSGSSFGAHLHFEIRRTANQATINTVTQGIFKVTDNIPPTLHQLAIFTLDSTFSISTPRLLKSIKIIKKGDIVVPEKNEVFEVCNPVYFGVWATDYQPNSTSKHGINRMTAYIDEQAFYGYALNEFLFEESRYINSFIAYEELKNNNRPYVKTYVEDGNKLSIYKNVSGNGLLILNDTLPHTIRMDLFDDSGNKTTLTFAIKKSKRIVSKNNNLFNIKKFRPVLWNVPFNYESENLKVAIADQSLYSSIILAIDNTPPQQNLYAPVWNIGNPTIPLQKPATISLKATMHESLRNKALIVRVNKDGKIASVGGTWDNDNNFITANVSEFGAYSVAIDTVAPTIKATFKSGADMRIKKALTVTIADNLSGIASYNGYIDGEWALFDYDAKTRSLTYRFDASHIKKGKRHKLKVVVEDGRKNSTTLTTEFLW